MNVAFEIAELKRRMDNMVRGGTIVETDYMAEPPRAKIKDGEQILGWMFFMALRANGQEVSWDVPEIGERVMALSPSGDLANGRIIPGALYCTDHPQPAVSADVITRIHKDGAFDTYNRELSTRTIQIPEDGAFKVQVGQSVLSLTDDGATMTSPAIMLTADTITLDGTIYLGGAGGEPVARKGDDISHATQKITKRSDNVFST